MNVLSWWDRLELKDRITAGLALAAVVIAVIGLLYARKSAKAADRSATEAGRSTNAAERQAEAAERQADATEQMLARASAQPSSTAGAPTPPVLSVPPAEPVSWSLWMVSKNLYRLRNIGTQDATNVEVKGLPEDAAGLVRFSSGKTIQAGHAAEVMVLRVSEAEVDSLEVTWDNNQSVILPLEG